MSMSNGRDSMPGRARQAPAPGSATPPPGAARAAPMRRRPPMPVIHQIAWVSLFLQLLIVGILIGIAVYIGTPTPILAATIAYLVLAALIRLLLIPVLLRVMGKWAWYVPRWAHRVLPDVTFGHA